MRIRMIECEIVFNNDLFVTIELFWSRADNLEMISMTHNFSFEFQLLETCAYFGRESILHIGCEVSKRADEANLIYRPFSPRFSLRSSIKNIFSRFGQQL